MNPLSLLRRLLGGRSEAIDRRTRHLVELCEALLAERAEYAGAALARGALTAWQELDPYCRGEFFDVLARAYSPSPEAVGRAADAYRDDPSPVNFIALQHAVDPPRQELFRRLNMAPGGTAALVGMRGAVLKELQGHPEWRVIDSDLLHLLRSWFNRGFLRLERIDWRTPALVLEKLIEYEAVHAVQGWRDLRRRLEADRRCFAFFHPQLPDEPIIFIEVALTRGISTHVQPLLDVAAPVADAGAADTAVFYSITNCQDGLRGISFGNLLIKQVAEELQREFPHVRRFATLSPVPGLRRWLDRNHSRIAVGPQGEERLALLSRLQDPGWYQGEIAPALEKLLVSLCAHYLLREKQGEEQGAESPERGLEGREPLDAVARFHLANGASLERINWLGDTSEQGMARSAGVMVNYVYRLSEVERNHERYFRERAVIASSQVEKLAREVSL